MLNRTFFISLILLAVLPLWAAPSANVSQEANQVVWNGDRSKPQIALTFDDGPKPEFCLPILNILDQFGVKATFFIIGKEARWHPDLVYRIYESGHDLGNHTYSHYRLDSLSREQMDVELKASNEIIATITGKTPLYFRPPGGRFNKIVVNEVGKNDLQIINWSLNAGDYTNASKYFNPTIKPNELADRIIKSCRNGDIILMHNGGGPTTEALPKIIMGLRQAGFEFVTVSQLLNQQGNANLFSAKPDGVKKLTSAEVTQ
ncbi:MAG: polysaccharide deacetylase family protein [Candidatus Margulisiibacteriota bacterium]